MLIKNAPHPNAAQLFVNWFASKEAQTIYEAQMMETSLRTDISAPMCPSMSGRGRASPIRSTTIPSSTITKFRMPAIERLQKELQR